MVLGKCARSLAPALLLSGCTLVGHAPAPVDWPKLEVNVYKAGFWEVQKWCHNTVPLLKQVFGCARIRFDLMRCDIWVVNATPEYEALAIEHDQDHCDGKDHIGSSYLRDLWERYKKWRSEADG